ncbi:MAG: mechanosensitive ion channel family protein [Deferrisomatales bacterium]|nr:mechanosensitive ion channel family protein [Deferrisomatales bacterium]
MVEFFTHWLTEEHGLGEPSALLLLHSLAAVAVVVLSLVANTIAKRIILRVVARVIHRTQNDWDDVFLKRRVFERLSHLAPALVIYWLAEAALWDLDALVDFAQRGSQIYMIVVGLLTIDSLLDAVHDIYGRFEVSRRVPIKGFVQIVKIVVICLGGILIVSTAVQKSPGFFLGGIGAMTAVVMLVFRDPILGFVAGIQLTANRMLRPGDWIEMPKYGADGDVLEVGLTTVKVQNWDKTITTIPTYALISDSFKNWRGMQESGGRRIKRAIHLDMTSVKFCDAALLARLRKFSLLAEYVERKRRELEGWNRERGIDLDEVINARRLTNLGCFRAYLEQYLRHHPKIHQDMTFLVRQLAPTAHGLPMEIYVFSSDQAWANYEAIQADIFDHLLAILPEFELRVFQTPSGGDVSALAAAVGPLSPGGV